MSYLTDCQTEIQESINQYRITAGAHGDDAMVDTVRAYHLHGYRPEEEE